jgi:Spy/CpxP family protein refolding chaperone
MSSFWSRMARGSVIAIALGMAACASRAEAEGAASVQAGVVEESPDVAHLHFIKEALSKVSLRPDQQQVVDQLAADAQARHAPIEQARQALANALADQVQAGAIDRASLQTKVDALVQAIDQARPAGRAALVKLHDLLDPTQRNQFVDALEAEFHGHGGEHGGHKGEGRGMMMRKWASDLNLTDQQREQIHTAMRAQFQGHDGGKGGDKEQWRAAHEGGRKMFESFRQDQFTIDPNVTLIGADQVQHRVDKIVSFAQTTLPILTPEQRAIAAQKIRTMHAGNK